MVCVPSRVQLRERQGQHGKSLKYAHKKYLLFALDTAYKDTILLYVERVNCALDAVYIEEIF